jgi:glutamate 5-kinase
MNATDGDRPPQPGRTVPRAGYDATQVQKRRYVVKIGTSSLTDGSGRIHPPSMWAIARAVLRLESVTGVTPVIVSSGAGAAGRERLGLTLPATLPEKQAAAAVGQTLLMLEWQRALAPRPVAQLLLTADDVHDRTRYVNAKHALTASLRAGAIPIVNENDSVATQELKLGDNDTLSAWVAYLVEADALVILTDVGGLYDRDPRTDPDARLIDVVDDVAAVAAVAGGSGTSLGVGGMATKLKAATIAREAGIDTYVVGGGGAGLEALCDGRTVGTHFLARHGVSARKAWLSQLPVEGTLLVDEGAVRALGEGRSLLPRGVRSADGRFSFGAAVDVVGPDGTRVARGLANYASDAVQRIAGRHTREIAAILGTKDFDEVVHRDNLVAFVGSRARRSST